MQITFFDIDSSKDM